MKNKIKKSGVVGSETNKNIKKTNVINCEIVSKILAKMFIVFRRFGIFWIAISIVFLLLAIYTKSKLYIILFAYLFGMGLGYLLCCSYVSYKLEELEAKQ